jgi:hypothetical protein
LLGLTACFVSSFATASGADYITEAMEAHRDLVAKGEVGPRCIACVIQRTPCNVCFTQSAWPPRCHSPDACLVFLGVPVVLQLDGAARLATRLALTLHFEGRHPEALVYFDAVLAHHPRDVDMLFSKGVSLQRMGAWCAVGCAESTVVAAGERWVILRSAPRFPCLARAVRGQP